MSKQNSGTLVAELQRRVTNLSADQALQALNRACRWINRQASFQFLTAASKTLTVATQLAASTTYTGTIQMKNGQGLGYRQSGDLFDSTGIWGIVVGTPLPATPLSSTGHPGLTITIDGDDYTVYWAGVYNGGWGSPQTDGLMILGNWPGLDGIYTWSLTTSSVSTVNGPGDFDPGKAKSVLNIDGSPIQHVPSSELWTSQNYNIFITNNYDTYTVVTDNTVNPATHTFYFFPSFQGAATLYYHKTMTDLTGGGDYSPYPPDFDDLAVDIAEVEERRIYDVGDQWQILAQRNETQIKVLIDGYKTMTQQPGMVGESAAKIQEETTLGKA